MTHEKAQQNHAKCYEVICEVLANDEQFREANGRWISFDEVFAICKARIPGLTEMQFNAAMEVENDEFSPEVLKYMKRVGLY